MRNTLIILLGLLTSELLAQNKNTIFYDSVGHVTTWEGHWAQVVTGRYKSIYNKSENKKTLVKTTREEFETELRNVLTPYKTGQESENRFVTVKLGEIWQE